MTPSVGGSSDSSVQQDGTKSETSSGLLPLQEVSMSRVDTRSTITKSETSSGLLPLQEVSMSRVDTRSTTTKSETSSSLSSLYEVDMSNGIHTINVEPIYPKNPSLEQKKNSSKLVEKKQQDFHNEGEDIFYRPHMQFTPTPISRHLLDVCCHQSREVIPMEFTSDDYEENGFDAGTQSFRTNKITNNSLSNFARSRRPAKVQPHQTNLAPHNKSELSKIYSQLSKRTFEPILETKIHSLLDQQKFSKVTTLSRNLRKVNKHASAKDTSFYQQSPIFEQQGIFTPTSLDETCDLIKDKLGDLNVHKINEVSDNINVTVSELHALLKTFSDFLSNPTGMDQSNPLTDIIIQDSMTLLAIITNSIDNGCMNFTNAVLVTSILYRHGVCTSVIAFIKEQFDKVDFTFQSNQEDYSTTICNILITIFAACAMGNKASIAEIKSMDFSAGYKILREIKDFAMVRKSFTDFGKLISDFLYAIAQPVAKYFNIELPSLTQLTDYDIWKQTIQTHYSNPQFPIRVKEDIDLAKSIIDLYVEGLTYRKFFLVTQSAMVEHGYVDHLKMLQSLYKLAINSPVYNNAKRDTPFGIYIYGIPGQGKSTVTKLLATLFCLEKEKHLRENNKPVPDWAKFLRTDTSRLIYNRNSNTDFMDNYHNQPVFLVDDFLQKSDNCGEGNTEALDYMNAISDTPWMLNMASVEQKGNVFFSSDFVILTSNMPINTPKRCLNYDPAFLRRVHADITMTIDPKYSMIVDSKPCLDTEKVNEAVQNETLSSITDVYRFTVRFVEESEPSLLEISFDQLCDVLSKRVRNHLNAHNELKAALKQAEDKIFSRYQLQSLSYDVHYNKEDEEVYVDAAEFGSAEECWQYFSKLKSIKPKYHSIKEWAFRRIAQISPWLSALHDWVWKYRVVITTTAVVAGLTFASLFIPNKYLRIPEVHRAPTILSHKNSKNCAYISKEGVHIKHTSIDLEIVIEDGRIKSFINKSGKDISKFITLMSILEVDMSLIYRDGVYSIWFSEMNALTEVWPAALALRYMCDASRSKEQLLIAESRNGGDMTPQDIKYMFESDGRKNKKQRRQMKQTSPMWDNFRPHEHDGWAHEDKPLHEACVDSKLQVIDAVTRKNLWVVLTCMPVGNTDLNIGFSLLFLRENIAVAPKHAMLSLKRLHVENPSYTIYMSKQGSCDVTAVPMNRVKIHYKKNSSRNQDWCYVEFTCPADFAPAADITKHFIDRLSIDHLTTFKGILTKANSIGHVDNNQQKVHTIFTQNYCDMKCELFDHSVDTFYYEKTVCYSVPTAVGDCGSPCWWLRPSGNYQMIGFHILGSKRGNYSQVISREDILEDLQSLIGDFQHHSGFYHHAQDYCNFDGEEIPGMEGDFNFVGTVDKEKWPVVFQNSKSNIEPSPLHGLFPVTSKPAHLRAVVVDGVQIDPMVRGLQKAGTKPTYIPEELVERCVTEYFEKLSDYSNFHIKAPLTLEEAIMGIPGEEGFEPIRRNTSMGYPLANLNLGSSKKTHLFGCDENWIVDHEIVVNGVQEFKELAQKKEIYPVIFADTLKDETRPIDKVDQIKTRVFSAGPAIFTTVFRQYYQPFTAFIQRTRINNEIAVGIDVFNYNEWEELRRHLQRVGKGVFAGDFSNYDGTLNPQILIAIFNKIIELSNVSEYDANVMRALYMCIVHSYHIKYDKIYQWSHGQPSGCPITSIVNSIYNSVMARVCYYSISEVFPRFSSTVKMISYGDDNVFNFPDWFYEGNYLSQFCAQYSKYGMTYTSTDKKGVPKQSNIGDVEFLKRKFSNLNQLTAAPRDLEAVLDTVNWVSCKNEVIANITQRVDNVADELMLHGEAVFNSHFKKILKKCVELGIPIRQDSFKTRFKLWELKYAPYNAPL